MNPNWPGIFSAALAFAGFFIAYRATKDQPLRTRVLLTFFASLAALPGASFAVYYAHLLPEASWYYQFRSLSGTEFLVIFIGVAGGLIATLLPRVLLLIPLLGVAAFSFPPFVKPFIGPLAKGQLKDQWDGDICLQSTGSTCGAASTATILRHLGGNVTEAELATEAHSYAGGTEAWYLARAARSRGFDAYFDFRTGFSPEVGLPAVVGVELGAIGHFIAILGQQGDQFIVGDPLKGRELLSLEEMQQRYTFTGFHMRIKTQNNS